MEGIRCGHVGVLVLILVWWETWDKPLAAVPGLLWALSEEASDKGL